MKVILKTILLIGVSLIVIYFMTKLNILHMDSIKNAFINNREIIYEVFALQVLGGFLMSLRYFSLLKIFNINVDFKNVTAATFVSNGLGLWLPGSMAFIEIIRIALMVGAENKSILKLSKQEMHDSILKNNDNVDKNKEELSIRSRLTTVSLFDRLIGLWAMLFIGMCVLGWAIYHSLNKIWTHYEGKGLFFMFVFIFLLLGLITFLPYVSKSILIRKIIEHMERFFLIFFRHGFFHKLFQKIFFEINSILDAIAIGGKKLNRFLLPVFYSFLCVFIQSIGTYYCAIAISSSIPFAAILATSSILAIATLLPIGFGGIGGVQIVAAVSMSFFGVMPQSAASAQLLQTAINIISISVVGLFFSKLTSKQIQSAIKTYELKRLSKS